MRCIYSLFFYLFQSFFFSMRSMLINIIGRIVKSFHVNFRILLMNLSHNFQLV